MATKIFKVGSLQFETAGTDIVVHFGKKEQGISAEEAKELFDWLGQEVLGNAPVVLPASFAKAEIALPQPKDEPISDAMLNRRVPEPQVPVLPKGTELFDVSEGHSMPKGKKVVWSPDA